MHFYTKDGESAHDIVGANGKLRPTTIRDARKLGLVPSVSTVKDLGCGMGLVQWMINLALDSALAHPYHPEEYTKDAWKEIVLKQYSKEKGMAAQRGTEIHDLLDQHLSNPKKKCNKDREYIMPVLEWLHENFHGVQWVSEKSFVHPTGFGGRVDLHSVTDNIVLDFKTKDKTELNDKMQYDDHKIQLSAYQEGLGLPAETKRYNLFVSVNENTPGLCHLVEATEHDRYYEIFQAMLTLWKLRNKYDPAGMLNG